MSLTIYGKSEADLIKGCMKQERAAQKHLYERFSPKMYALCCRYVKNPMEAEDVLITAFTKILERIEQFKGDGSFEGWIRRVVVNEALTWLRKNRSMYIETEIETAYREPDYQTLSDHLEAADLMNMIQELPSGYRIVFNMYAIDGYSHKEIAAQLNITESTSKSQLSRARVFLQKLLADQQLITNRQQHDITT